MNAHREPSIAQQVNAFIDAFDTDIGKVVQASRRILRSRFQTGYELVYDNYSALAIGWSPTERTSDVVVSLAVYTSGVNLYFMHGAKLPDPQARLQGKGRQGRFVRLRDPSVLRDPEIASLLDAAEDFGSQPFPRTGRRRTVIRSASTGRRRRG